jgi:hypothetical protein
MYYLQRYVGKNKFKLFFDDKVAVNEFLNEMNAHTVDDSVYIGDMYYGRIGKRLSLVD